MQGVINWKYWAIIEGVCLLLMFIGICRKGNEPQIVERTDVRVDTFLVRQPIAVHDTVVRTQVRLLAAAHVTDTVVDFRRDSVYVEVPITQRVYADSTYRAWVSGYEPQLDSIRVYSRTITHERLVATPPKRWSVGIQGGVGMTPKGVQPYVGVGVSFRIF